MVLALSESIFLSASSTLTRLTSTTLRATSATEKLAKYSLHLATKLRTELWKWKWFGKIASYRIYYESTLVSSMSLGVASLS